MDMSNGWWWSLGTAAALGGVAGGWFMVRIKQFQHGRDSQRAIDSLQKQNATLAEQLSSAQTSAQIELEHLRQSHKRQRAPAQSGPDAAGAQAEQRLLAAYDELDRLRRQIASDGPQTVSSELNDGFALTQPMYDRM